MDFESRLSTILIRCLTLRKISPRNPRRKHQFESSDSFSSTSHRSRPKITTRVPTTGWSKEKIKNGDAALRRGARLDQTNGESRAEDHGAESESMRCEFRINEFKIIRLSLCFVWRNFCFFFRISSSLFVREMGWGFAGVISPRICEGRESDEFAPMDLVGITELPLPCPKHLHLHIYRYHFCSTNKYEKYKIKLKF